MSDKVKKGLMIGGGIAVAVGTVCVCIAGGDVKTAAGIATLAGAAVAAVGALVLAIVGKN